MPKRATLNPDTVRARRRNLLRDREEAEKRHLAEMTVFATLEEELRSRCGHERIQYHNGAWGGDSWEECKDCGATVRGG